MLEQTVGSQNLTIATLEEKVEEKCDVIDQQTMSLQQINDTLQGIIENADQVIPTLQQAVASQNQTIVMLEETVEGKCDVIDQQTMTLQQLNDTLLMFIGREQRKNFTFYIF